LDATTAPSTVADSEILMHRRRSQIPKYWCTIDGAVETTGVSQVKICV